MLKLMSKKVFTIYAQKFVYLNLCHSSTEDGVDVEEELDTGEVEMLDSGRESSFNDADFEKILKDSEQAELSKILKDSGGKHGNINTTNSESSLSTVFNHFLSNKTCCY